MDEVKTDNSEVIARLTRERDEARAEARTLRNAAVGMQEEVERLREHHKVAVDWWMQEAQSVKPLTEEVERLREERDYYRRDNEKLNNALAWEHNESENAMDARRYRWLNSRVGCITEGPDEECGIVVEMTLCVHTKDGGEQGLLTEWINAAMREGESNA